MTFRVFQVRVNRHAFIFEDDTYAGIEVSEFTHTVGEDIVGVNGLGEDGIIRPELHECTGLTLFPVTDCLSFGYHVYRSERFTFLVVLCMDFSVTIHFDVHFGRKGIYAAHTYTVETTGHLVTVFVKFTTCVQDGHNDFQGRAMLFRMHIHRNTTTVILNGNGVILVDVHSDFRTETS